MEPPDEVQLESARRLMALIAAVWAVAMVVGMVSGRLRILLIATLVGGWAEGVAGLSALRASEKLTRGQAVAARIALMATGARVDVVGSAALREVFERLSSRSVYFSVAVPPPDNANETGPLTVTEIVALATPEERKKQAARRISSVIALVDEARSIIREELDLHD